MNPTGTLRRIIANRRFDPRAVVAGIVVLLLSSIIGFLLLGQSSQQADQVAAPVAALCRQGGDAGAQLATSGACRAAGDVTTGIGPYQSDANPTVQGARGETGAAGANGVGVPGATGQPGVPGAAGQNGVGTPGATGPAGPSGSPGLPGIAGQNGDPGEVGESGETVVGPQGPPGDTIVGPQGPQGPRGEDGNPAASQTFATGDGRIFQCVRTGGSDEAPIYRCDEQAEPSTEPTP